MSEKTGSFRLLVFLLAAAFLCAPAVAQDSATGRVANPHGSLNIRCENCHTSTAWKPIRKQVEFDHDRQTSFPLQGLHQGVACQSCHANLVFSTAPTRCAECHADLHRRQFGADCQSCHTVSTWRVAISSVQKHSNRFPLIGAHAAVMCDDCHHGAAAGVYTGLSTECVSCHLQDYQRATPLNHVTAKLPVTCQSCHNINAWTGATFNHTQFTSFALTGAHATVQCAQCHANGVFAGTSSQCVTCHVTDFNRTTNPNHQTGKFSTSCEGCHTTSNWQGATFDHSLSSFPLTGAHTAVACAQCHVNGVFTGTPSQCVGCHLTDFQKTTSPNHATAGFPQDCAVCHSTTNWTSATFNHATTGFELLGLHATQQCAACHLNNNYSLASAACWNCHQTDYNGANNPPHKSAGFPQDCSLCHGTSALNWTSAATFDHAPTGFALTGAHTSVQCAQCHANNNFSLTSGACWGCHQTDFNNTNNPPHKSANFPQDCSGCHTTVNWDGATFNHAATGFALAGVHATQQCTACHVNNNYTLSSTACWGCHQTDFNGANNPPHKSAGFPQDCTLCHGSSALNWTSATFDHATTGFTLTGAHTSQQCAACHVSDNYNLTSGACWGCHQTDFNNTSNPPHKSANFPQDCSGCHTTTNWTGATFNHAATGFALVGLHATQQCTGCHLNNNYSLTSAACSNCHLTDFNGTTDPPHKSAGFPLDCTVCHGSTAINWTSATAFNHTTTGFTLTGAHVSLQCVQCHVSNNYSLTSGACWGCHQTDFNNTNNPPHKSANFPQDCSGCHTTTNWDGATFNHAATGFTLTGAHVSVQCALCHVSNNYSLTSGACWGCHQTDFNNTNNPPHKSANFPQDCSGCHTTTNWDGATFNHATTGFALVGLHASQQCAGCHVNGNFSLTSAACSNCHQTDYNGATNPPHKAAGFPMDCTLCHGSSALNWTSASFNHTTTGFTLTGAHTSVQCAQCHVNNNYTLTSGACWDCHQTDYNGTNAPPHKSANFPQDCSGCHTTTNWSGATFNHATTGFALAGVHATQQCGSCHANNNYTLNSAACWGCHQTDFNGATNPPHKAAGFPQDCTVCHGSSALNWTSATFNHATTGFTLTGAHTSQQCAACHVNSNYSLSSGACWGCHQTDYNGTNNPAHKSANFPQDCSGCHTTTNWSGATFNHASTGFALVGIHATGPCTGCHLNNNYSLTSAACINCHQADFNGTTNPPHKSAGFPQDCTLCHGSSILNWTSATFNHTTTGFTLTGAHVSLQCQQCHGSSNYSLTSGACWNCHQTDYNGTNNPPHKSANFPQDCSGCHNTANWDAATFNHATTGFTLVGLHASQQCAACHVGNNYTLTSTACWGCHQTDYNGANNPPHKSAGFPQDCTQCHGSAALNWTSATFNHTTTGFALVGLHASQQCAACHVNNNYSLTSAACWGCHQTDYNGATNPAHKAAGFPQDCTQCHGSSALNWTSATFNHATTGFTLTGAHATVQCAQCHVNSNYSLTSGACWGCHQTDYNGTNAPPHKSANFPQDCSGCHTTTNWDGATFNHATTGFTLVGLHASQQCAACHVNNNYSLTSAACWGCHQTDYNGANNPPHKASGFPQDCTQCHGSSALNWTSATFNHATTGFTLTGAHASQQCAACHVNNNYSLTSGACWNCHQTDYNGTNNPPHKSANFPQDCSGCHTTTNWDGATFNHATTGFALVGLHASQQCAACHVNNNYSLTSAACWNCHQTDYNGATNPPHKASGFPQDCTQCHGTSILNWTSATFNHTSTGFALTGAHTSLQCAQCHVNNNYSLTSGACWNCHQTDYNGTNAPPHKAANFPQDCSGCHTTTNWDGATFNHATTGFTLVGLHASQQCAACHVNNNYSLTSAACWNCHQTDYNGAMSPPHLASGFPQDCTQCHGSTALNWTSATFNHASTGFTLTGAHTSLQCAQCHVNNNYSLTSGACWNCHQTDYNGTTNPPHKASGFPQDCSGCHTTTDWTGAVFNHATTGFTLTGTHATTACALCHVNNNYTLSSAACWNCHQADYNGTNAPPHATAGFPQDCSTCHSTTNWSGATFTHPSTPLALTGFHATMLANNQCAQCHVGNNYTTTPSDCYSCHKTDYANTTNPGHAAAAFPTTCNTCHTFVDWTGATYTAHDAAYFPIYSGNHKGKWTTCADCHTNSANYAVFSCIICHQHSNQTSVTSQHNGVKNFVYNGTSCYSCHPRGNGG